jgi:acyl-coenzyme A synthetase/AMP-(fatty) acid ligase
MHPPDPALPFNMAAYCLAAAAAATPRKAALIVTDDAAATKPREIWSFAEIEDAIQRVAAALADRGLARGDRVMIRLANTSTYALMFFGAIAGGYVPLPVSSLLTADETSFMLADSSARLVLHEEQLALGPVPGDVGVIGSEQTAAMLRHLRRTGYAATRPDDPAFLIYTSGTTARPKGVLHAHRSAYGRRPMYQGWYGLTAGDRVLHAGAFNWTFTLGTGLTDPWANGATAIVYTGPREPSVWPRLIAGTGATLFAAVPGVCRQILKHARSAMADRTALRHGLIAGETPPAGLFDDWRGVTGTELYEALGMSEISTYVSSAPIVPRRPGAVGKAQPGRRIAILPEDGGTEPLEAGRRGLLAVHRSDPGLMLEYWNRPTEVAEVMRGAWFVGGDLASIDRDGYVTHHGRANDLMNAMGYRVSPREVEQVLEAHPGVQEAACAEVEVTGGVRVIAAFIVARDGATPDEAAIRNYAAEHLAAYKVPREVRFVASLPRTANGKVQRSRLG